MQPPLNEATAPIYQAFLDLSPSRHMGLGEGGVQLSEIESYIRLFGHPACDDAAEFVALIRACDAAYLEAKAAKND